MVPLGLRSTGAGPVLAGLVQGRGCCVSGPCWGCAIPGEGLPRLSEAEGHHAGRPLPSGSLAASISLCAGVRVSGRSESRILLA